MDKIYTAVTSGKHTVSQGRHDDDFADRLCSKYTPLILIVFTIFVTLQQIVRNPITCWAPVHFTGNHEKYANNYCWVKNTYYLPYEDEIPRPNEDRQMLRYYQWIQFILLGQAVFFFFPTIVWRTFNSKAGVDADNILKTAHEIPEVKNAEKKDEKVEYLASLIDRFLESRKPDESCQCDFAHFVSGILCRCCGRRVGNFLVILYVVQKLLFLLNIVLQFVVLSKIFGQNFFIYGPEVVKNPTSDHYWYASGYVTFPRVTMCDFQVRRLGNLHRYTLQCVLPLNLFIEKLYMFQWFWLIFVMFMLVCSFIMWSIRFISRKDRLNFIKNHLYKTNSLPTKDDEDLVDDFLDDYLRQDGAFLLRLVAGNTNHVSTSFIITGIWDYWRRKTGNAKPDPDERPPSYTDEAKPLMDDKRKSPDMSGLKQRKPNATEENEKKPPRKNDLSRVPTLYVRAGSDTLNNKRPGSDLYPKINKIKPPNTSSDSKSSMDSDSSDDDNKWSPKTEPSVPSSDGMTPLLSSDDSSPRSGGESPKEDVPQGHGDSPDQARPPSTPKTPSGTPSPAAPVAKPRKGSSPQVESVGKPLETSFN